ncbi:Spindle assembly checkpoint component MAD1 [Debaryomyces fabryi]|uniref:Spindle assembly checkpoint component MAD1 n=1 Tax=Debaryomyces fabryi TaxID=58627 RepID=A0A0V1PS91_9ASCO|nr:Spindle assembly checkpoint component MAD1 [Debaryomyces fabryi]KRZ99107.1 Spindle assembly checkpoint component MAD1 [Debaryomyces fabryi]CUM56469.1 unnamed protein product [Debaryomyces fabryi]
MSDTGSSPFIDRPRSMLDEDSDFNSRQIISNLQFQISSLKTEKSLLQQSKESMAEKYEALLKKKNEEVVSLQNDFDYVFKQRDELQSKYDNIQQINSKNVESLQTQLNDTTERYEELKNKHEILNTDFKRLFRDNNQMKSEVEFQKNSRDQINEKILSLQEENKNLYKSNDELIEKLNSVSEQLVSNSEDRFSKNLSDQNAKLQKANNQLQLKVDQLLQHKTSLELLRQKNNSLANKLSSLSNLEEKCCKLEIENLELSNKFDTFFKTIEDSVNIDENRTNESVVIEFMDNYKRLQNLNLVLQDKYNQSVSSVSSVQTELSSIKEKYSEALSKIESLNKTVSTRTELIDKLERQKLLNVKEIEYLRGLLKKLEELNLKRTKEETNDKSTEQYMSNLEKLVDEYRTEINTLQKQVLSQDIQSNVHAGNKRPRIIDNGIQNDFKSQVSVLEKENLKLLSTIKNLEYNNKTLGEKLQNLESLDKKKKELHILQLKSNPASQDQLIKQQTLDLLSKENQDMIEKFVKNKNFDDLIPKSLFERQENDKLQLQTKIDQLNKRINRLREIYSQKSRDILSVISKFFGYTIEFLPSPINPNDLSSRIKLVSKYMNNKDESNSAYLILDVNSKSLKANGSLEFKTLCEDLVTNWISDKDQIPCFLSALNLSIYDKYAT